MATNQALNVAQARQFLLAALSPVSGCETLPIVAAQKRVLYRDIVAPFDVPAHTNSAMDGYALRIADLAADDETRLSVIGTALAGNAFPGIVGAGQAVRIMTGAVLPHGADTVVAQEVERTDCDALLVPP